MKRPRSAPASASSASAEAQAGEERLADPRDRKVLADVAVPRDVERRAERRDPLGTRQLGDGSTTQRLVPVPVEGLTDAVSISVGTAHSCAIRESGQAVCWGYNFTGQSVNS